MQQPAVAVLDLGRESELVVLLGQSLAVLLDNATDTEMRPMTGGVILKPFSMAFSCIRKQREVKRGRRERRNSRDSGVHEKPA
jgi:hypothetical protein